MSAAPVKHVDESGWFKHGKLCWLWLAATSSLAVFAIHAKRGKAGFRNLLGKVVVGFVCSDRWSVYALVEVWRRQLCWAHLKRDFRNSRNWGGGEARKLGHAGLRAVKKLFEAWHEFKEKRITREELQERVLRMSMALYKALERGRDGPDKKVRRFCKRLLKDYEALWLFADMEGVEPTNNHAERCLRPAVMWRKRSFGNHSEEGCRFTERLLTAVQTLKTAATAGIGVSEKRSAPPPRTKDCAFATGGLLKQRQRQSLLLQQVTDQGAIYTFFPRDTGGRTV